MSGESLATDEARDLAQRWLLDCALIDASHKSGKRLDLVRSLFAWVRARMDEQKHLAAWLRVCVGPPPSTTQVYDRRKLAYVVGLRLGGSFECGPDDEPGDAYRLCEAAGWPEDSPVDDLS